MTGCHSPPRPKPNPSTTVGLTFGGKLPESTFVPKILSKSLHDVLSGGVNNEYSYFSQSKDTGIDVGIDVNGTEPVTELAREGGVEENDGVDCTSAVVLYACEGG